jgi:hypothetical protein
MVKVVADGDSRTCVKQYSFSRLVTDKSQVMYKDRDADGVWRSGRTALAIATLVIVAACTAGCGSSSPTTPTPPNPPSATLTGVKVTAASPGAITFQLVATARFSDGTSRDVTSTAQWASSNPLVATVAPTGMVTVVGTGDVDLRATYQTVTDSLRLHVVVAPQPAVTLSGVVREVKPNEHPLAGVRIEITTGLDAGKFTMSDRNGTYQFTGLTQGSLIVAATMTGYEPWQGNLTLTANRPEDVWLVPTPPKDGSGATATARCKDGSWSWSRESTGPTAACVANGGVAYPVCPGPFCPNARVK